MLAPIPGQHRAEVVMGVVEPGRHLPAMEIHDLGSPGDKRPDLAIGPHGEHLPPGRGHRLHDAIGRIDCPHSPVHEREVRRHRRVLGSRSP
jgi:hypothetical protein